MKEIRLFIALCITNFLAFIQIIFIMLFEKDHIVFGIRDALYDNVLHNYVFSKLADEVVSTSLIVSICFLVIAIIATFTATQFWGSREHIVSYRILIGATFGVACVYVMYILNAIVLGHCRISECHGIYVVVILLLPSTILGIIFGNVKAIKARKIKTDAMIAGGILLGCIILFVIPAFVRSNEEFRIASEARSWIKAFPDSYREDVGEQIGNFYTGDYVYANDKLYFVRDDHGNSPVTSQIYSVDASGIFELVYDAGKEIKYGIFYNQGYLYLNISNDICRVNPQNGVCEILYEGDIFTNFGVADNKLFIVERVDSGNDIVYYSDIKDEILKDNFMVYDAGIDGSAISGPSFVSRYLYNDDSYHSYRMSYAYSGENVMSYAGNYYYIQRNEPIGCGEFVIWDGIDNETKIYADSDVVTLNLYQDTIYYVKEFRDDCHEIWSCDLQGENKCYIGTVEQSEMYCLTMGVGEDFVYLEMATDDDYKMRQGYIMSLDDGSVQKIY